MFILILLVVLALALIWSIFAARHLWRGRKLRLASAFFIVLDLGGIIGLLVFAAWLRDMYIPAPVLVTVAVLFVAQLIFSALVSIALLIRFLARRGRSVPFDPRRRELLARSLLYPVAATLLAAYGGACERQHTVINRYAIPAPALGERPYTIAQISDVHLGRFFSVEDLRALLERIAALPEVSLLAVTGDIFDDNRQNEAAIRLLDEYVERFPDGIAFCYGNHEHFRNLAAIRKYLADTRVLVLENAAVRLPCGLWLAGVDYPMDRPRFTEQRRDYHALALAQVPQGAPCVLLAHHPECIDDGAESGVLLTLTGHTHGGQFGIFGLPLFPIFRYNRGLVRLGDSYGYVHCGNGSWFPCRIGCPPEIALFTLG